MHYWPLQDAKAQLSKLIHITRKQGPQGITVRGQEQAVLMTKNLYDQLTSHQQCFTEFIWIGFSLFYLYKTRPA